MLKKFLKEVISIVVGKHAEEIVDLLDTKKYINEFVLAKKLDITINQTRNILYKISDHGLVSSIRKKDKRKGWYTYFWKIEVLKSLEFLKANLTKKKEQFQNQIKSRETKRFYICERCSIEVNEENALLYNFTCNECGAVFTMKDNAKLIRDFKKHQERIEKDLGLMEIEIKIEKEKIEKKKSKERKKEEKIAKKKRASRKKAKKLIPKKKKALPSVVGLKKKLQKRKARPGVEGSKKKPMKKKQKPKKKIKKKSKKPVKKKSKLKKKIRKIFKKKIGRENRPNVAGLKKKRR